MWGGESPKGFDCSGLIQYVYEKLGVSVPRTTYSQWSAGQAVSILSLQPGDLVFWRGADSKVVNGQTLPGHVAMYVGNGQVVQSPTQGQVVQLTPLADMGTPMGARRIV